jgi:hypothetical protein
MTHKGTNAVAALLANPLHKHRIESFGILRQ